MTIETGNLGDALRDLGERMRAAADKRTECWRRLEQAHADEFAATKRRLRAAAEYLAANEACCALLDEMPTADEFKAQMLAIGLDIDNMISNTRS